MKIEIYNCLGHSSSDTHQLDAYAELYGYAMNMWWFDKRVDAKASTIDPFARKCLWGTKRNDINPEFFKQYTTHCMDALEFMQSMPKK